jgi:hypothetical protein
VVEHLAAIGARGEHDPGHVVAVKAKDFPVFWQPDGDPSWQVNPGLLVEVSNLLPGSRRALLNYCCGPGDNLKSMTPFADANTPNTAAILKTTTGLPLARMFIGGNNRIYEQSATVATDVSRAAGGPYTATEWCFDAFGNIMIATCGTPSTNNQPTNYPQISSGVYGTAFADLTGTLTPPKATLCVVQQNFLLLFNVDDGTNWNADGWNCSGLGNLTSWSAVANLAGGTPGNLATQANSGRLLATPGAIRAAVRLRDKVAVYKEDSMYMMSYQGNPYTWGSTLISDKVGQASANGTAIANGVQYFLHRTGVYRFDGSYPQNIGIGRVNKFLAAWMSDYFEWRLPGIKAVVVENENLIIWYMAKNDWRATTNPNVSVNCALAYNYATDQFGWLTRPWEESNPSDNNMLCPVQASRSDATLLLSSGDWPMPLIVGNQGGNTYVRAAKIGDYNPTTATACGFVTGDIGDEYDDTTITEIKPRLVYGDDDLQNALCNVDFKRSQAEYYTGEGFAMTAVTTGLGTAYAILRSYPTAPSRRTVTAGDYMAFDFVITEGDIGVAFGIQLLYSDATTENFVATPAGGVYNAVNSFLGAFAGGSVGKVISTVRIFATGAAPSSAFWRGVLRRVRVVDSTGLLRERLVLGNERRINAGAVVTGAFTGCATDNSPSVGQSFGYSTDLKTFGGTQSSRWQRISMTLWNRNALAAIALNMTGAGNR